MTRKLIAFALSFTLTMCGLATAQNQQSWGSMALMRAGPFGGGGWVNPDPNASQLLFWYSMDNVPFTNSVGRLKSDIPSGDEYAMLINNGPILQRQWITNSLGNIDYGIGKEANNWVCSLQSNRWGEACEAAGIGQQMTGITIHAAFVFTNMNTTPRLFEIYTRNDSGTITNYLLARGTTSITISSQSNAVNEANTVVSGLAYAFVQLTVTYKANEFKVYTNAVLLSSDTSCVGLPFTNYVPSAPNPFAFGAIHSMRDFRVYKTALSPQDVTNLCNGLNPIDPLWTKPLNFLP